MGALAMAELSAATDHPRRRPFASWTRIVAVGITVVVAAVVAFVAVREFTAAPAEGGRSLSNFVVQPPLDPQRALENIVKLCEFGPRPTGSEGMRQQQEFLRAQFSKLGGLVRWQ